VTTPTVPPTFGRQIIDTAELRLAAKDVAGAARSATEIVLRAGGFVGDAQVERGDVPSATMTFRVPPAALIDVIDRMSAIATVRSTSTHTDDVTGQSIDVDARVASARASVARVRDFLARATNIGDLAQLEAELTRRETELETLVAQQNALGDQVALATLKVQIERLTPDAPIVSLVGKVRLRPDVLGAFRRGAATLGTALLVLAVALATIAPLVAVLAVLLVPVALVWRRRRRAATGTVSPRAPGAGRASTAPERETVEHGS
jgi:hypothetical protein